MRLFIRIIVICLIIVSLVVVLADSGIASHRCGASLELKYEYDYRYYVSLYDFNTGISLSGQKLVNEESDLSTDGLYRFEIPEDRNHDVILIDTRTNERRLVYRSRYLQRASWSADSSILMVWTYDGMFPLLVTRINTRTAEPLSSYGFPPLPNGQRNTTDDRRYLYTSYALNTVTNTRGLLFVDTVTGVVTRFRRPTTVPYLWSADSRWIASQFEGTVSIIDPVTGTYHPDFPEAFAGEDYVWHENALWFSRVDDEGNSDIWRAKLSDASVELMIEDARLDIIAENGEFATIVDGRSGDVAIYDFATENRFLLNIAERANTHQRITRYSDNGRCMAILLRDYDNPGTYEFRIIDLQSKRTIQQRELINDFYIYQMRWVGNS